MNWLTSLFRRSVAANTSARRAVSRDPVHSASQPIEQLESRELLAVFSVNSNVADGAAGSLRAAIQNANANQADDTIYLTPGRYVLSLDNSVAETTVGDRGDLDVTESGKTLVLQGSGTDSTILDAAGLDRVLEAHPGSTLVLRDLTLTGGKATQGGGLFATGAKVVLENVTVRQNEAESGGGIALSGGQMTMSDSLIEANIAKAIAAGGSASGGGIRADSADVRIHNSTISGNSALAGNGRSGQSVHEVWKDGYGIPNFYGARIGQVGGDATGGAIAQKDGLLVVTNSVIGSNRAQAGQGGDGGNGGSMYEDPGQVPVSGNLGGIGGSASGGGIFADGAEVTLSDAIVSKNSAIAGNTGADRSTNWSLANSSKLGIAGASASGAGIFINAGQLEVAQSVVVQNSAEAGDGGNGPAGGFDWDDRYFVGSKGGFPGGIGGTGGSVFGSGIFGSSSSVQMIASTISGNVGNAGRGGTGGKGGSGFYVNGGAGGTGGKGGDVNGLGVYLKSGTASTDQSSIQSNNGSAGVGGSGGSGGYGEFRYSGRDASSGRSGNAGTVGAQVVGTISNTDSTTTTTVMLPAMTGSFELRRDGDDVVLRDSNQTDLFRANASDAKRLEIIGSDGDDTVIVDASIAELNVLRGLKIDGGGGTNTLQLRGTAESVSFSNFTTGVRGEVTIDRQLVEWANVSTLQDTVIAKARDFAFSAADDVVEVTDGAAVADGISQLRVNGTSFDFTNPTESLRIDARGGADRVTLTSIDAGMKAAIVVAGGGGDDQLVSMLTTSVQLLGGDGNDSIRAGTSGDSLIGGNGNDSLFGGLGTDLLIGGAGDDVLFGGAGNDRLMGEAGRDMLTGNSGLDSLFGGDDDDTLRGGAQNDALDGGNGFDQVLEIADNNFTLTSSQLVVQRVVANSVDPNAVPVVGSALEVGTTVVLADNVDQLVNIETASLIGGVSSNRLDASKFAGPATLRGFNGDDTLLGGSNDDVLEGDEGNDQLDGGTGVNRLLAEGDRDWRLTAGQLLGMGTDSFVNIGLAELRGGVSANRLDAVAFLGQVTLLGGEGDDTLLGSNQADVLIGDGGNDQLIAKGGNDSLTGGDGDNTLNGGPGIDRVVESGDVDFTLTAQQLSRTGTLARLVETSNNDVVTTEETGRSTRPTELWNIEEAELTGGAGNNRLSAKKFGGAVTLRGGDGNDTLEGGSVADVLDGGAGRDRLLGRAGDDTLLGGTEKDLLLGGDGNDQLNGGDGADVLNGEAGADHLMGDAGNDRFEGDFASDTLDGGEGRDAFELKSSGDITLTDTALTWTALTWTATATLSQMEQVTLRGDAGSQRLDASGFSGSTTLDGVAGDDTLLGARGDDLLLVASLNTSTVDGGAGFNTLARSSVLGSGESSYDLATTTANLDRISRIDLRGPDLVSLTLHARQFIATSGKGETLDLQLDSNDQLTLADVGWKNVRTQNGRQELIQATRHLDVSAGVAIQQSSAIPAPPGAFLKSEIESTFYKTTAFADLDGDGDLDAVDRYGQLSLAQPDGSFVLGASLTSGYNPKLADIDDDGDIDVIGNATWKNDGNGVFSQFSAPIDRGGEIIAIVDMDGDRDLDIVSASGANAQASNPHLEIWSNDGTGKFTLTRLFENVTSAALSRPTHVVDVDGDGDLDIYQAAPTVAKSHLWLNRGNGQFNRSAKPGLFGEGVSSVAWGDIDGDGDADAIVKTDKTSVWWNNKGVFTRGTQDFTKTFSKGITSPALADFDNDGDQDIVAQMSTGQWTVLINQSGRFVDLGYRLGQMQNGNFASNVRVIDVNADGRVDLFFNYSGSWSAWLNLGELQTVTLPTAGGRFILTRDVEQFVLKAESGTELSRGPIAGKTLLVGGSAVSDQLVVDVSQGNPLPEFGLSFRGAAGSDGLELTGGSVDSAGYEINRGGSNRVRVGDRWIELSAIESLSDGLIAADRKFKANYSVTLSAGESPTDGLMRLDLIPENGDTQPFTRIDFAVPSNSLSIEGEGYRTIRLASVDDSFTGKLSASNTQTIDASALSIPVTLSNGAVLLGGSGNDTLISPSPRFNGFLWSTISRLVGGAGDDTISGTGNLIGGDGNDSLTGGANSDLLDGGAGNDTLTGGGGHDLLLGRSGADLLDGGDGDDVLLADLEVVHWIDGAEDSSAIPDVEQLVDTLLGGAGDDALIAGLGADLLDGQVGIDTLSGLDTDDVISNPDTADKVAAQGLRQILFRRGPNNSREHWVIPVAGEKLEINVSQPGSNVVVLSNGLLNDIAGELLSNSIDKIAVLGSPQADDIDMSQLYARSFAFLGAGDDTMIGSQNDFTVKAGAGNDHVFAASNSKADISGGDGNDLLFAGPFGGQLSGDAGQDTLVGTLNGIYFNGGDGNDVLIGAIGNDSMSAGAGDDLVLGGAGNDTVVGGTGVDTIDGGSGTNSNYEKELTDVANGGRVGFFDPLTGRLSIYCSEKVVLRADVANGQLQILVAGVADAGLGSVPVSAIQSVLVFGSSSADSIDLSAFAVAATVYGGSGNDTIIGTQAADVINGGFDNDSISGGAGDDTLFGNDGNDTLNGDAGRDVLNSGSGKDSLTSGADND